MQAHKCQMCVPRGLWRPQGWRAIQAQSRDIPSSSHGFLTREGMCQT